MVESEVDAVIAGRGRRRPSREWAMYEGCFCVFLGRRPRASAVHETLMHVSGEVSQEPTFGISEHVPSD